MREDLVHQCTIEEALNHTYVNVESLLQALPRAQPNQRISNIADNILKLAQKMRAQAVQKAQEAAQVAEKTKAQALQMAQLENSTAVEISNATSLATAAQKEAEKAASVANFPLASNKTVLEKEIQKVVTRFPDTCLPDEATHAFQNISNISQLLNTANEIKLFQETAQHTDLDSLSVLSMNLTEYKLGTPFLAEKYLEIRNELTRVAMTPSVQEKYAAVIMQLSRLWGLDRVSGKPFTFEDVMNPVLIDGSVGSRSTLMQQADVLASLFFNNQYIPDVFTEGITRNLEVLSTQNDTSGVEVILNSLQWMPSKVLDRLSWLEVVPRLRNMSTASTWHSTVDTFTHRHVNSPQSATELRKVMTFLSQKSGSVDKLRYAFGLATNMLIDQFEVKGAFATHDTFGNELVNWLHILIEEYYADALFSFVLKNEMGVKLQAYQEGLPPFMKLKLQIKNYLPRFLVPF